MKKFLKYVIVFILLFLLFNFLLFITSLFPSSWIEENVEQSSKILLEEGNFYYFSEEFDIVNNNYTDALMVNEAYSIDNKNPIYSYMSVRKNYKRDLTNETISDTVQEAISINNEENYDPVGELNEFLNGNIHTSITYARYWHGYLPFLRLSLIFFNISEIRTILLIIFMILFTFLMCLIRKKIGIKTMLIYAFALIAHNYFLVSYSLESTPVFLVMMIASIFLLNRIDKIKKEQFYIYIFIVAIITNFVDYLTVPLITLAMPLYLYILYNQKTNKELDYKYYLKLIITSSIIWLIGYSITWISKWILYAVFYNPALIRSALTQVIYRTSSSNPLTNTTIGQIIKTFLGQNIAYIMIFVMVCAYCIIININKLNIRKKEKIEYLKENIPIFIISLMPFVWYIVLSNHTILHYRFVYRHMLIFLIGILILITNVLKIEKR